MELIEAEKTIARLKQSFTHMQKSSEIRETEIIN